MVCSCGWVQMEEPVSGEQAGPIAMGTTVPFSQVAVPWSGKSSPLAFLQPSHTAGNLCGSTSEHVHPFLTNFQYPCIIRQTTKLEGAKQAVP